MPDLGESLEKVSIVLACLEDKCNEIDFLIISNDAILITLILLYSQNGSRKFSKWASALA